MKAFEKSKWIWISQNSEKNAYGEFLFKLNGKKNIKINISCDGDYTLFVNGTYVASNQYGDYEHYKIYDTLELDNFLVDGENTVAILVWHQGENSSRYILSTPGLIFEIYSGEDVILSSDERVLARKSLAYKSGEIPKISSQLGYGFEYDATKEDGWANGEAYGFLPATVIDKKCEFYKRPYKKLAVGRLSKPTLLKSETNTHFLYDLGGENVGFISFNINATEKTKIIVAYGEHILDGGVRRIVDGHDFSIKYTAKKGENIFTNYMLRLGAKYIEVFSDEPIEIKSIGIIPHYVPVTRKKNDLSGVQSQIYDACVNTLEKCMQEHYVDCPWREGCLYAFDSRNQMMCGYYAFEGGNFEYARSNLILMSKDRRNDGLLSICYPCGIDLTIPSFSLHFILATLEYLIYSGDKSLVYEVDFKLKELLNTFLKNRENGVVTKLEGKDHWNFYDWSPYLEGHIWHSEEKAPDANISLLTIIALKAYKEICQRTGMDFGYDKDLKSLSQATKETFFDKESNLFINTQSVDEPLEFTNSIGVIAGILTNEEAEGVCAHLAGGALIKASLSTRRFVYDALLSVDKEKYASFILEDIERNYKIMLDQGADTVWETMVGAEDFGGAGSLCHGWSAIPIYYYSQLKN